jgi:7-carboxy-7-deazaguanine synthase
MSAPLKSTENMSVKIPSNPIPAKPGTLRITESYACIEGEGITLGAPTFLIRLSGCNLRCWWCDSKFSSFSDDEAREIAWEALRDQALASNTAWISFTGGEPTWRDAGELVSLAKVCHALRSAGRKIKVETNGLLLPEILADEVDLWSVAPKWDGSKEGQTEAMRWDASMLAQFAGRFGNAGRLQFKFVITFNSAGKPRSSDLDEARKILQTASAPSSVPVFLIPEGLTDQEAYLDRNRALQDKVSLNLTSWSGWDLRVGTQWHRILHGDSRKK